MTKREKNIGRSVEEVILRRKMQDQNGTSILSSSLPLIKSSSAVNIPNKNYQTKPTSKPGTGQANQGRYTEEEVRKMMEEVMKYSRSLQSRVQELEIQLIHVSRNKQSSMGQFDPYSNTKGFADVLAATRPSAVTFSHSSVADSIESSKHKRNFLEQTGNRAGSRAGTGITADMVVDIDNKVTNLKEIFRKNDPIEERKQKAVKIQSLIRGFLARCRFKYFSTAQREWRWIRCRPVIWLLDILLANQSKLDSGFNLLKMNRVMKTMHVIFGKWAIVCRQNAPLRRAVRQAAEDRIKSKKTKWLRAVFNALRAVTVGKISTKNANQERRRLVDTIRQELSRELISQGESGVVPEQEIKRVLHRRVIDEFKGRKRVIALAGKFKAWLRLRDMARINEKDAKKFRFQVLAGKCFYSWSDYTYLKSRGLDRKRWPAARKYEVRYNQKRVDNFAKIRSERVVFVAWKAYFAIQYKVKRSYQRKVAQFLSGVFQEWRKATISNRTLRRTAYQNWIEYPKLMVTGPFQAWAEFVRGQKNKFNEHVRIAKAYRRWKGRQKLQMIMKVWRHQALFGRLDGLYTRQMLLKSLGEQKIFTNSLEKVMADQTVELEECRQVVNSEIDKRKNLESEILRLNNENNKLKMTNHHFEQEINRMESVIHSMTLINPKQMDHLKQMQPEFKFRERMIATKYSDDPPVELDNEPKSSNNLLSDAADVANEDKSKHEGKLADEGEDGASLQSSVDGNTHNAFGASASHDDDHSVLAASETQSVAGGEVAVATAVPGKTDEVKKIASDVDNGGPKLNEEDARLLERSKWLIERYRQTLGFINDAMEKKREAELLEAEAKQRELEEQQQQQFDDEGSLGEHSQPRFDADFGSSEEVGPPFETRSPPSRGRNTLLRASNPFVRSESFDMYADNAQGIAGSDPQSRKPSIAAKIKSGFRSSFSRQSMLSTQSSFDFNAMTAPAMLEVATGGPVPEFYNDEELEDTVITWAKMLFTFLEFLDTGDITNLPAEDKRLWANHLYSMTHTYNEVPAEMLDERDRLLNPPQAGDGKFEQAIYSALVTVDERMHGGVSWREALMRLRTMFPAAGNFSGFGMGNDSAHDMALFNRLLKMREDLKKVEDIQTVRFQRNFLKSQQISPKKKSGSLKKFQHNTSISSVDRMNSAVSLTYTDDGSVEDEPEMRPLGTNIYAGNLKKLKVVEARQEHKDRKSRVHDDDEDDM